MCETAKTAPNQDQDEKQDQLGPFRPLSVAQLIHLPRVAVHDYRERAERMVKSKLAWWLNHYGYELTHENGEFRVIVRGPLSARDDACQRVFNNWRTAVSWINDDIAEVMGAFAARLGRVSVDLWSQVVFAWFERTVNGLHPPLPFMLLVEDQAFTPRSAPPQSPPGPDGKLPLVILGPGGEYQRGYTPVVVKISIDHSA